MIYYRVILMYHNQENRPEHTPEFPVGSKCKKEKTAIVKKTQSTHNSRPGHWKMDVFCSDSV